MRFSTCTLLPLFPFVTVAQNNAREVLVIFYNQLGGPSWTNKAGWEDALANPESNMCDWFGVVCEGEEAELDEDFEGRALMRRRLQEQTITPTNPPMTATDAPANVAPVATANGPTVATDVFTNSPVVVTAALPTSTENRRIIGITLKSNNLRGRLPNSLWKLQKLQYLVVSYNEIDVDFQIGSISLKEIKMHQTITSSLSGIGAFSSLRSIHMSGSQLGNIALPLELFTLTNLEYLYMAQCQIEGSIPEQVGNLVNLGQLNFYDNDLTGTLPASLGNMTAMKVITLSFNKLQGTVPSAIGELLKLEELYLDHNQFTGKLPAFEKLSSLHDLFLNENQLTGIIPPLFMESSVHANATKWQINLDNNNLGSKIPSSLEILANLNLTISLANNNFDGFENDTILCDNNNWNDGFVTKSQCNGILCPVGFVSQRGNDAESPCEPCKAAIFMGETTCLSGDDTVALAELYRATGGDYWKFNTNWLKTKNICEWYGITCWNDVEKLGGGVRWIKLDNNGLIGTVPLSIYSLTNMTTMMFSRNKVVVGFEGIEALPELHEMNIAHTDTTIFEGIEKANAFFEILIADQLLIEGTLPKEIYELTNLMTLSLSECQLNGVLGQDLGKLSRLEELYLWGNNLRGQLPETLGNLTALSILSLAQNSLTGTLPKDLDGLIALNAFSVKDQVTKGGGLSGQLIPFKSAPKLTNLVLAGNKFGNQIPTDLLQMVNLDAYIIADLSSNDLTGEIPGIFAKFGRMNLLVENNLIDGIDKRLCANDDWMNGNVGALGCDAILCPLYTANANGRLIYDNQICIDCTDPNARAILGQTQCGAKDFVMTEHNVLEILYNECGGSKWIKSDNWYSNEHICNWYGVACDDAQSVVSIVLGNNALEGTVPATIFSLPNLVQLSLFSNPLLTIQFDGIESASNLQVLQLDSTGLTSLTAIGKARSLTELNVGNNNLVGTLPQELSRLVNLETLVLSNNQFTGPLPEWLAKMPALKSFSVDENQLSGKLIDFGDFESIVFLNVSDNNFVGAIPPSFLSKAGRDDKIFVDVSSNKLTGTLPYDLQRFNRLGIKADENKLSGIDPQLCTLEAWNDYDVKNFGCNGILCPSGTYNDYGRQISEESPCQICKDATYMGATQCSSAIRLVSGLGLLICFGTMLL